MYLITLLKRILLIVVFLIIMIPFILEMFVRLCIAPVLWLFTGDGFRVMETMWIADLLTWFSEDVLGLEIL